MVDPRFNLTNRILALESQGLFQNERTAKTLIGSIEKELTRNAMHYLVSRLEETSQLNTISSDSFEYQKSLPAISQPLNPAEVEEHLTDIIILTRYEQKEALSDRLVYGGLNNVLLLETPEDRYTRWRSGITYDYKLEELIPAINEESQFDLKNLNQYTNIGVLINPLNQGQRHWAIYNQLEALSNIEHLQYLFEGMNNILSSVNIRTSSIVNEFDGAAGTNFTIENNSSYHGIIQMDYQLPIEYEFTTWMNELTEVYMDALASRDGFNSLTGNHFLQAVTISVDSLFEENIPKNQSLYEMSSEQQASYFNSLNSYTPERLVDELNDYMFNKTIQTGDGTFQGWTEVYFDGRDLYTDITEGNKAAELLNDITLRWAKIDDKIKVVTELAPDLTPDGERHYLLKFATKQAAPATTNYATQF